MKFTLRQLEVFLATARHENVTKAAEQLAMSQSAASGALKELEHQFDLKLFDRVGKRLQLNEDGARLRVRAEALLAQAKEVESAFVNHNELGALRVGATLTIGNYLAVELIHQYLLDHPEAKVDLEVANTASIVQEILNFDIDLGLVGGEFTHSELDIFPWREDNMVCFSAPSHPLVGKQGVGLEELTQCDWILRESGSGTRQAFERAMGHHLTELHVSLELQHTEAITRAVQNGLGVSCLSEIALHDAFKRGDLVPLDTPSLDFARQFYFVIHKHKYRSVGLRAWMSMCGVAS